MKETKATPGSNKMWEGSRMMLPEHVTMINQQRRDMLKKQRPELDETQLEDIDIKLRMSNKYTTEIEITLFGEFEDRVLQGVVVKIDPQLQRVKLELEDELYEWINVGDILGIENV